MTDTNSLIYRLRALSWAINLTRMNIVLLLITSILLSVGQGQDLLRSMLDGNLIDDPSVFSQRLSLYGSTLIWALAIWLWARVLLDIDFKDAPVPAERLAWFRRHLPRLLAVGATSMVAINLWRASITFDDQLVAIFMGLQALLLWLFLIKRRAIGRAIANDRPEHWAYVAELDGSIGAQHQSISQALQGTRGLFAKATALLGVVLFIWGLSNPLGMGQWFNTLLLLMLWGATLLPFVSIVTYWGNCSGIPVVTIGTVLVVVFSLFNDNHPVRLLDDAQRTQAVSSRPTLDAALNAWQQANCTDKSCNDFVLVATAGGGIRAAYWTGTVLAQAHDKACGYPEPKPDQDSDVPPCKHPLDTRLFAISGVSGGSVGAVVYRTLASTASGPLTGNVQRILGTDYLGPVSAGLLYPDITQRLLPTPVFSDRAKVFEQGLEAGFADIAQQGEGLSGSFVGNALFKGQPWPALYLNSTWSDAGRRIVAATLQTHKQFLYQDLLDTLDHDIRLSTAAHNSARFPLVSPAGYWIPANGKQPKQRLQDGGLFENYGAETALELLSYARDYFTKTDKSFNPLVVLISSDPTLPKDLNAFPYKAPLKLLASELSTFHTYATVRTGRGAEAASRLQAWAEDQGQFVHFRMCKETEADLDPPLGWALSLQAQKDIRNYLAPDSSASCAPDNRAALNTLLQSVR